MELSDLFKKNRGWTEDIPDDGRDWKFEEHFEDDIFGAVIPEEFERDPLSLPRISHQHRTVSCVINSFNFVNAWHSKQEGNDVFFAWRFPYALIRRLAGGTSFRDNGNFFRKTGVCLDHYMPQSKWMLALNQGAEQKRITPEMYENAENFKTKGFYYVRNRKEDMKVAIMKAPLIIGVYTNSNAWNQDIIKYDGNKSFGHAIVIWDWKKHYWEITDWQGDGTIKKLDINHPIMSAVVLLDKPDGNKIMYPTIKEKDGPKIFAILPNSTKSHITSMAQYKEGVRTKVFGEYKTDKDDELKNYPDAKHPLSFSL